MPVAPEPEASEPDTSTPAVTAEEPESPEEVASDAALRAWAKDNGIEDVPASGRLSASWRDQITSAMAAALDPKDEDSVESTSPDSSTSTETKEKTTTPESESEPAPAAESIPEVEYHSVFKPPNTFMSSQAFTA